MKISETTGPRENNAVIRSQGNSFAWQMILLDLLLVLLYILLNIVFKLTAAF